jgi:hypothetical protein
MIASWFLRFFQLLVSVVSFLERVALISFVLRPVLRTRNRRIRMFLGLLDPDQDPLVRGMDPDPSILKKEKNKKNLDSHCFVTSFWLLSLKNYVNVSSNSTGNKQKNFFFLAFWRSIPVTKIAGSGSESESGYISERHDLQQNVMDPQQWLKHLFRIPGAVNPDTSRVSARLRVDAAGAAAGAPAADQTDATGTKWLMISVADPGCLSRIRIFSIPYPGSWVKKIPASAAKNVNPKFSFWALGYTSQDVHHPESWFFTHPGSRGPDLSVVPSFINVFLILFRIHKHPDTA